MLRLLRLFRLLTLSRRFRLFGLFRLFRLGDWLRCLDCSCDSLRSRNSLSGQSSRDKLRCLASRIAARVQTWPALRSALFRLFRQSELLRWFRLLRVRRAFALFRLFCGVEAIDLESDSRPQRHALSDASPRARQQRGTSVAGAAPPQPGCSRLLANVDREQPPRGPMDEASAWGSRGCRFESCRGSLTSLGALHAPSAKQRKASDSCGAPAHTLADLRLEPVPKITRPSCCRG